MFTSKIGPGKRFVFLLMAAVLLGCFSASALTDPVPRVLFVGDSWTGFMLAFRSFREVFLENPDLERWVEVGNRTAEMGGRVWEMLERDYLDTVTDELMRHPNIDVVVITLGGNDILRGIKGAMPDNPNRTVSFKHCFNNDPANEPWDDFDHCIEMLAEKLEEQIGTVVDHILDVRPDIRVAIMSYDYAAREPKATDTFEIGDQHMAFIGVEFGKRAVALGRDRVEYINNFGLMQYIYGIPEVDPPIPPGVAPYPCNDPSDVDCEFWPGGYPQYLSPLEAYIDQDIHLTAEGYKLIVERAVDMHLREWLNYPKALEILPLNNKGIYQFEVTFSHPVDGVDVTDFEVFVQDKAGLKSMEVMGVEAADAEGVVYTVTVNMDGTEQAAYIRVLDNDSITRKDTGVPLGGPGAGNGWFEYNGLYEFADLEEADDDDFEGAMNFLYRASMAYEHLLGDVGISFNPELFDVNGNLTQDGSLEKPYSIPGNGMLDFHEFMVIDAVLKRPGLDLSATGGLTHDIVKNVWETNIVTIQEAMGGVGGLADLILPGLDTVLAGFFTMGDFNSHFLAETLITLLGTVEDLPTNMNPGVLPGYDRFNPDPDHFLPQYLAFNGDADGDGWTNMQEYTYFAPDGVVAYVNAVLDPEAQPIRGDEQAHMEGTSLRLGMFDWPKFDSEFQWYKDGVLLVDEPGRIAGANARALDILSLELEDAGAYTCVYTKALKRQGNYVQDTYGPIVVRVRQDLPMPAAGGFGLAALVALSAVSGAFVLRNRKK